MSPLVIARLKTVDCSTFAGNLGEIMVNIKTATLTFRIDPALKEALRTAADLEHRSIANMIEVLIISHCEQQGIQIYHLQDQTNTGISS